MHRPVLLVLPLFLLSACAAIPALLQGGGSGPRQVVTPITPFAPGGGGERTVYCYNTLGKPDCYYEPQSGAAQNRMLGVQQVQQQSAPGLRAMPDGSIMNTQPLRPQVTAQPPAHQGAPKASPMVPDIITKSTVEMKPTATPPKKTAKKSKPPPAKTFDGSGEPDPGSGSWPDKPM